MTPPVTCSPRGDDPPAPPAHGRASPPHIPPTGGRRQNRGAPRAVAEVKALWLLLAGSAKTALPRAVAEVQAPQTRAAFLAGMLIPVMAHELLLLSGRGGGL
jgi:hypothetical protein